MPHGYYLVDRNRPHPSRWTNASKWCAKRYCDLVQRFGSALNLNIHHLMIACDGVYTVGKSDKANDASTTASYLVPLLPTYQDICQHLRGFLFHFCYSYRIHYLMI